MEKKSERKRERKKKKGEKKGEKRGKEKKNNIKRRRNIIVLLYVLTHQESGEGNSNDTSILLFK